MQAKSILETVIYADDPEACAAFYRRVFGLAELRAVAGRFNFLRCGGQMLLIFAPGPCSDPAQQAGIPTHGARGAGHLCFGVDTRAELDAWREELAAMGVEIERDLEWPDGGRSLYLRDPAGNSVEIAEKRIWPGLDASGTGHGDG